MDPAYLTYADLARELGKTVAEMTTVERMATDEFWEE